MFQQLFPFLDAETLGWLAAGSIFLFFATLLLIPILIVRIPADYFLHTRKERQARSDPEESVPWQSLPALIVRNIVGIFVLLLGIVMLVTPGQGILCILLGLTLISLPGKEKLVLRLIRRPHVLKVVNSIRAKAHKPALELPAGEGK